MPRRRLIVVSLVLLVVAVTAGVALLLVVRPDRLRVLERVSRADLDRCEAVRDRARELFTGKSAADVLAAMDEIVPVERLVRLNAKRWTAPGSGVEVVVLWRGAFLPDAAGALAWGSEAQVELGSVVAKGKGSLFIEAADVPRVLAGPVARMVADTEPRRPASPISLTPARPGAPAIRYAWASSDLEVELVFTTDR